MSFYTPLRYPGGKARLGPWLAEVLRHNKISGGLYAEPYAGGAGAALYLLMRGYVDHIRINDADPVIFAFWYAATKNTKRLVKLVHETPVTMDTWHQQQEVLATADKHSPLKVGFATFFLNRTNRSGILSGGVIGGKDQNGNYGLDARFNKDELIKRIEALGSMTKSITVTCLDARDWLVNTELPEKSLIYLDPPYYIKGSQLYRNFYKPEDHAVIATLVEKIKTPVLVTYDDEPQIRSLYRNLETTDFSLHYSTHRERPKSTEAMFYKNLSLPCSPILTRGDTLPPARTNKRRDIVPERVDELLV